MGREFLDLFENWAESYDSTVTGHDPQYQAVFNRYDAILQEVVNHTKGNVLEFGVGTGNLSEKLLNAGHQVIGIEPSAAMRKEASSKYEDLVVLDGDFLNFPEPEFSIDTIVSSYAFHHLTNEEKGRALQAFYRFLPDNGKIVFADTLYENEEAKQQIFQKAEANGFTDLLQDLKTEYYPMLEEMQNLFKEAGFYVTFKQMNEFVWLIHAEKSTDKNS